MAHRVRQVMVRCLTVGAVALALSLLAFAGASTTHAAPMPHNTQAPVSASHPHAPCYITVVILHGTNAPTVTCKLATKPNGITPLFNQVTCGDNLPSPWVALYENAGLGGQGGAQICFSGTGSDNLNNYRINFFRDWTNAVSSVNPGSNGKLTSDFNGNGNSCPFSYGHQISWINTPCPGFNDTAKWVAIFS